MRCHRHRKWRRLQREHARQVATRSVWEFERAQYLKARASAGAATREEVDGVGRSKPVPANKHHNGTSVKLGKDKTAISVEQDPGSNPPIVNSVSKLQDPAQSLEQGHTGHVTVQTDQVVQGHVLPRDAFMISYSNPDVYFKENHVVALDDIRLTMETSEPATENQSEPDGNQPRARPSLSPSRSASLPSHLMRKSRELRQGVVAKDNEISRISQSVPIQTHRLNGSLHYNAAVETVNIYPSAKKSSSAKDNSVNIDPSAKKYSSAKRSSSARTERSLNSEEALVLQSFDRIYQDFDSTAASGNTADSGNSGTAVGGNTADSRNSATVVCGNTTESRNSGQISTQQTGNIQGVRANTYRLLSKHPALSKDTKVSGSKRISLGLPQQHPKQFPPSYISTVLIDPNNTDESFHSWDEIDSTSTEQKHENKVFSLHDEDSSTTTESNSAQQGKPAQHSVLREPAPQKSVLREPALQQSVLREPAPQQLVLWEPAPREPAPSSGSSNSSDVTSSHVTVVDLHHQPAYFHYQMDTQSKQQSKHAQGQSPHQSEQHAGLQQSGQHSEQQSLQYSEQPSEKQYLGQYSKQTAEQRQSVPHSELHGGHVGHSKQCYVRYVSRKDSRSRRHVYTDTQRVISDEGEERGECSVHTESSHSASSSSHSYVPQGASYLASSTPHCASYSSPSSADTHNTSSHCAVGVTNNTSPPSHWPPSWTPVTSSSPPSWTPVASPPQPPPALCLNISSHGPFVPHRNTDNSDEITEATGGVEQNSDTQQNSVICTEYTGTSRINIRDAGDTDICVGIAEDTEGGFGREEGGTGEALEPASLVHPLRAHADVLTCSHVRPARISGSRTKGGEGQRTRGGGAGNRSNLKTRSNIKSRSVESRSSMDNKSLAGAISTVENRPILNSSVLAQARSLTGSGSLPRDPGSVEAGYDWSAASRRRLGYENEAYERQDIAEVEQPELEITRL